MSLRFLVQERLEKDGQIREFLPAKINRPSLEDLVKQRISQDGKIDEFAPSGGSTPSKSQTPYKQSPKIVGSTAIPDI